MKKLLAIGGVIVVIFILIVVLVNKSNEAKLKDNPYDTDQLNTATIDLIGNKHYSNIILPDKLDEKIASGDPVTAYFFSPLCGFCQEMTPIMMPIANEMDVTVYQYNFLEYENEASSYNIQGTPTIIHFKDGKETGRLYGLPKEPEKDIRAFFNEFESD